MNVLEIDIARIKPYENNPRKKRDVEKVANSIREFGWQQPIVVDKDYVVIDPKYFRPEELEDLKGDYSKLKLEIGWEPEYNFEQLMDEMIDNEMSEGI